MTPEISIILCTHNRADSLGAMLESLCSASMPAGISYELILVDNASTDKTSRIVKDFENCLPIRYLYEARRGKSFAANTGREQVQGELVVFADDDVIATENWLAEMWRASQRWHDAGCFQGRVVNQWDCPVPDWLATRGPFQLRGVTANCDLGDAEQVMQPVKFVGANAAVRLEVLRKVGSFRTDMGPGHPTAGLGEDTDFAMRMEAMKVRCVYVPGAMVIHPVSAERANQAYFRRWALATGRAQAKVYAPVYRQCAWLFGLPRYLVRRYLENRLRQVGYTVLRKKSASFYFKVRSWELEGVFREVRSWKWR
jgi:glycosyltransferase involved in cell wall biosynthesis